MMEATSVVHVLHCTSAIDLTNGGPSVAIAGLARHVCAAGMDVSIASTWVSSPADETAARLSADGVSVHRLGPCRDPMSRHSGLRKWLSTIMLEADVVHIHGMWESIQYTAARLARELGKPYVLTPHGMLDQWNMSQGRLKKTLYLMLRGRKMLSGASAIHFATNLERRWCVIPVSDAKAIVEPFGIEAEEFGNLPLRGHFASRHGIGDSPFILFLGRVDRGKGWELLIPAFAKATVSKHRDWRLVIAGPDYFGNLGRARKLAEEYGISEKTHFTGMLSRQECVQALVDCEFLALPSQHENFGIVVGEAMAAGRAVLVSEGVGLSEQVSRWNAGLVVRQESDQIAGGLKCLMGDREMRTSLGRNGCAHNHTCGSWTAIASRWSSHYDKVRSPKNYAARSVSA